MPELIFKFRETATAKARNQVLEKVTSEYPTASFAPVFPDADDDPELGSIYVGSFTIAADLSAALKYLDSVNSIEYVQQSAKRRPL